MESNPAGRLDLHILIEKEGDLYSALCLELNVASQGETLEEARKNIREAIELFLIINHFHVARSTIFVPEESQGGTFSVYHVEYKELAGEVYLFIHQFKPFPFT